MKIQVEEMIYEAPTVEIIEVEVEKGFATSSLPGVPGVEDGGGY